MGFDHIIGRYEKDTTVNGVLYKKGDPLIDGDWGNRSRAASMVFQNSAGITVTAKPDIATLNKLIELNQNGKKYADIFKLFKPADHQAEVLPDNINGHLSQAETDKLFKIRANNGGEALLQKSVAIAWAYLVNEIAKETTFDVKRFYPSYDTTGYRSYKVQVRFYAGYYLKKLHIPPFEHNHNSANAAQPYFDVGITSAQSYIWSCRESFGIEREYFDSVAGKPGDGKALSGYGKSNHGNGVAIDLDVQDTGGGREEHGEGYATTDQVRWLEANAIRFGFKPYLLSTDNGYGEGKIKVGDKIVNNYKETWHWNYMP